MHGGCFKQYANGRGKREQGEAEAGLTLESVYKSAIRYGITPADYWENDLRHIVWAIEAKHAAMEDIERSDWERTRWLACTMLQPHLQRGKNLAPTDLIRFPWETEKAQPKETLSEEAKQALYDKWDSEARAKWGK